MQLVYPGVSMQSETNRLSRLGTWNPRSTSPIYYCVCWSGGLRRRVRCTSVRARERKRPLRKVRSPKSQAIPIAPNYDGIFPPLFFPVGDTDGVVADVGSDDDDPSRPGGSLWNEHMFTFEKFESVR